MLRDASASPDPEVARLFMDKVLPIFARITVDQAIEGFSGSSAA